MNINTQNGMVSISGDVDFPVDKSNDASLKALVSKLQPMVKDVTPTRNPDEVAVNFVPFGNNACEFSIGKGDHSLTVASDENTVSVRGKIVCHVGSPEVYWLYHVLAEVDKAPKRDVTYGTITTEANPFA